MLGDDGLEDRAQDENWPAGALESVRAAITLCPGWLFWWSAGDRPHEPGRGFYAFNTAEPRVLHHSNVYILIGAAQPPEEGP